MKKLVRVSLFVLMALTLSLAIGCKNDSEPEPAPADVAGKNDSDPEQKPASSNFVGKWLMDNLMAHIEIKPDGKFSALFPDPSGQSEEMTVNGTYTLSEDGKIATSSPLKIDGLGENIVVIMEMENTDSDVFTVDLSAFGMGVVPYVRKSTSLYTLEGVWKNEDGSVIATVRADKTVSMSSSLGDIEGTYTQDGNTFTVTGNSGEGEILTAIVSVASGRGYASYWSGDVDYISDVFTKQQ